MRKATFATIATAGLAAMTFALASPASAAPTDTGTAQDTMNRLQAQGFTVIVNKTGNAPLSQCTVAAVKPGHTYSRTDRAAPGTQGDHPVTTVLSKTVNVHLSC